MTLMWGAEIARSSASPAAGRPGYAAAMPGLPAVFRSPKPWIGRLLGLAAALLAAGTAAAEEDLRRRLEAQLVDIPGGRFQMGDPRGEADERPRQAEVGAFRLMRFEVTRRDFAAFVAETGHETDPERRGFGFVWPGRWQRQPGASWRDPQGDGSGGEALADHPVVQVSARDAAAFCAHYGLRLPSDAEWELAARGFDGRRYPWGDRPPQAFSARPASFGTTACCAADEADGYRRTAPVGSFPAGRSPFGLWDMAGNVWEWTASRRPDRPRRVILRGGGWGNDPYCLRSSYRHDNPPDIGLDMVGFRCAADPR